MEGWNSNFGRKSGRMYDLIRYRGGSMYGDGR